MQPGCSISPTCPLISSRSTAPRSWNYSPRGKLPISKRVLIRLSVEGVRKNTMKRQLQNSRDQQNRPFKPFCLLVAEPYFAQSCARPQGKGPTAQRLSPNFVSVDFSVLLDRFSIQSLGVISTFVYDPQILKSKNGQNNPKTRRNRSSGTVSQANWLKIIDFLAPGILQLPLKPFIFFFLSGIRELQIFSTGLPFHNLT